LRKQLVDLLKTHPTDQFKQMLEVHYGSVLVPSVADWSWRTHQRFDLLAITV